MAGIAGLISERADEDSQDIVLRMSEKLAHRGEETIYNFMLSDDSTVILGVRTHLDESLNIETNSNGILIVEGGEQANSSLIKVNREEVEFRRHRRSMKPLYYARMDHAIPFSCERKALWEIGVQNSESLQPGQRLKMKGFGEPRIIEEDEECRPILGRDVSHDNIIKRLTAALRSSFTKFAGRRVGVLFSGGVDSSLVALLAQEVCPEVQLYSASSQPFHDRVAATAAAQVLGMNLNQVEINSDVVWEVLPHLLYAIERAHIMDAEIALPFYLASSQASADGISLVLSGQGPDELFAGYARHLRIFENEGEEALDNQLWKEVRATHETNIERDERAIVAHGVEAYFPYLSADFIDLALSIPSDRKVRLGGQPERKIIFRELARQLGLPESISVSPKKATQYSSGSSRMLMKSLVENVPNLKKTPRKNQRSTAQEYLLRLASELGMHDAIIKK
ncbi:MAG: asparagine synthase family protein [Candidatus Thorarchaeota archaeon]